MTIRKRASDAELKLRNDAKEGKVSLRKFKRKYPHGTMSDYKAIQKQEKEIGATNKTVFGASEKPVEKAEKKTKTAPPPQTKQMLGATPPTRRFALRQSKVGEGVCGRMTSDEW